MSDAVAAGRLHAPALAAIHAASFAAPERWDARAMSELLAMPGCFGLLHPAGGLILARLAGGESEILTLAVIPAARRCGVASALLAAALGRIGAAPVFLEVAESNAAALALYVRHGFAACGRRPRYYPDGGDALVLRRPPEHLRLKHGAGPTFNARTP